MILAVIGLAVAAYVVYKVIQAYKAGKAVTTATVLDEAKTDAQAVKTEVDKLRE